MGHSALRRHVYPNRDAVPGDAWLSLFSSAVQEIGILACSGLFLAKQPGVRGVLADRGRDGVRVRVCLRDPDWPVIAEHGAGEDAVDTQAAETRRALAMFRQ